MCVESASWSVLSQRQSEVSVKEREQKNRGSASLCFVNLDEIKTGRLAEKWSQAIPTVVTIFRFLSAKSTKTEDRTIWWERSDIHSE